ncbi:MAG: TonB-dependent receptor plug domain-containing protein [Balneolaceae bacterium]|nr:TonB-dependent receptor plug domain-containing protein [Balneolaceae bacterium]
MRLLLLVFFLFSISNSLFAQFEPDTLQRQIDEIVVVGYETNRNILETPVSVALVNPQTITGLDASSLLFGLNTIAGVRMEERAPGSYRISLRGSSLRSPFGIRNVKVYWNGIPFTEPTGTTFLNLLDVWNMQSVEVIKGPAGSLYGAGNGGVLLINSTQPVLTDQLSSSFSIGSFGSYSIRLAYHDALENGAISFKYSNQQSDGYREQSYLDRRVLEVSGEVEYAEGRSINANVLFSELNYGIPGGLNAEQFEANPTQARPGNRFALSSVDADASIKHEALLFGLTHDYQITDRFSNTASAYGTLSDFENPFNLDYKIDSRKSGGFRTQYTYDFIAGNSPSEISFGSEYQASSYASRNFENDSSKVGALNFDDELKVKSTSFYVSSQLDIGNSWILNAGASLNLLRYDIKRLFSADVDEYGSTGQTTINFDTQFVPRLSIAKKLSNTITAFGGIGYGFSPPTIEEVRTNEGSINRGLQPEIGTNFELGIRGYAFLGRWGFDATTFFYRLNDSIVQQESERGTTLFRNAGSTNQFGLELNSSILLIDDPMAFFSNIELKTAYTFNDFEFDDYQTADGDFSGNDLTGVAPNILVNTLLIQQKDGFYSTLSHTFNDEIPLEDDNSIYSESYQLVQFKLGLKQRVAEKLNFDVGFGIDNLLDEQYSRGFDINAFGGRYFQPAPERNWFITVRLSYEL